MPFHHFDDVSVQLQGAEGSLMILIVIIVALLISRFRQGFVICVWWQYCDCQSWGMIDDGNIFASTYHHIDGVY